MPNNKFDSKSFNAEAFKYMVARVPNLNMNEIKKSRALAANPDIQEVFSGQNGTAYARLAMRGLIDGDAVNYDGSTDITATSTKTFEQGVVVVGRAKAWKERDFSYDVTGGVDFNADADPVIDGQVEGKFLDDNTYACIFRYDLAEAAKDYTEYNEKYNEMTQQVMDEMGITQADLDDQTDEGYALLEEYINKVSERGGAYQKYIKDIEIPDTFNLHLDITKVRGLEADYEWSEADEEKYGTDAGYYKYEGDWSFDIPVTVDDSQTEVWDLNVTNDEGIGLKSVIRTPYELTVNELYKEGSNSDCFMVALDANGNTLPYNESTGNCNNFAIQDRDISTVDIYILDYIQYMDELKGPDNYNNNENKPEGQKWSNLLDRYAKYHKTLHFD